MVSVDGLPAPTTRGSVAAAAGQPNMLAMSQVKQTIV